MTIARCPFMLDSRGHPIDEVLDEPVDESTWPAPVERCGVEAMKAGSAAAGVPDVSFDRGADRFSRRGVPGDGAWPERCAQVGRTSSAMRPSMPFTKRPESSVE